MYTRVISFLFLGCLYIGFVGCHVKKKMKWSRIKKKIPLRCGTELTVHIVGTSLHATYTSAGQFVSVHFGLPELLLW